MGIVGEGDGVSESKCCLAGSNGGSPGMIRRCRQFNRCGNSNILLSDATCLIHHVHCILADSARLSIDKILATMASDSSKIITALRPTPDQVQNDPRASLSESEQKMYTEVLGHFTKPEYVIPGVENGELRDVEKFWLSRECILRCVISFDLLVRQLNLDTTRHLGSCALLNGRLQTQFNASRLP